MFLFLFEQKLTVFLQPEGEIDVSLKQLGIETLNSKLRWEMYGTTLVPILGGFQSRDMGFQVKKLKNQMEVQTAIAQKTNSRKIEFPSLKPPGDLDSIPH